MSSHIYWLPSTLQQIQTKSEVHWKFLTNYQHPVRLSWLSFSLLSVSLKSFVISLPPSSLPIITIMTSNTKPCYSGHCENVFFPSVPMKYFPLSVSLADSNQSPGPTIKKKKRVQALVQYRIWNLSLESNTQGNLITNALRLAQPIAVEYRIFGVICFWEMISRFFPFSLPRRPK